MDFGNIKENLPFIIGAIVLVIIQFWLRKRRGPATNQPEVVQNLLAETRLNFRMADAFDFSLRSGRFMTTTWQLNKDKLSFLEAPLQSGVSDAYMMVEDVNRQIAAAKKYKSTSYLISIDKEKLKGLLAKCQEGLEGWLLLKLGTKNPQMKAPGMFDDLLGKR